MQNWFLYPAHFIWFCIFAFVLFSLLDSVSGSCEFFIASGEKIGCWMGTSNLLASRISSEVMCSPRGMLRINVSSIDGSKCWRITIRFVEGTNHNNGDLLELHQLSFNTFICDRWLADFVKYLPVVKLYWCHKSQHLW